IHIPFRFPYTTLFRSLYDDDAKDVLEWFSDGVNAYIDEASEAGTLPPEFVILGEEPADWTPIDSLTIGKYMAFDLGGHWERQALDRKSTRLNSSHVSI